MFDFKAFAKKDIGKLASVVSNNADKIGFGLTLLSLAIGSVKTKNDQETLKAQLREELKADLLAGKKD